jgi:hypothetical protein
MLIAIVPELEKLTHIFSQATAPTFFLGSVAAFASLMSTRMATVVGRIRQLNAIPPDDPQRVHLKADVDRLKRRSKLLAQGMRDSLFAGICATILLAILFISEFFGLSHAYGAGLLFFAATVALGKGLIAFVRECGIQLAEADEYD